MPMERKRYPVNWYEIANRIKTEADWKCEQCKKECRKPGESLSQFIDRVVPKIHCSYSYELLHDINTKPSRFVLTTAHLDQNPANCDRSNLKALCSVCHLNYDRAYKKSNAMAKRERQGQLRLFEDIYA